MIRLPRSGPALECHRDGVARLARYLAARYGADPVEAVEAARLHDLFKDVPPERLKRVLRSLGVRLDRASLAHPAIWHGPAAEAYARSRLGIRNPRVREAVRWHTTGRARQGLLERILFVADFCERGRAFPEARRGRVLARRGLALAARYVLAAKLAHLEETGTQAHPAARAMWRELARRMR